MSSLLFLGGMLVRAQMTALKIVRSYATWIASLHKCIMQWRSCPGRWV
jgi:hypothetical protein